MASSEMLNRVALVRTDVSEEGIITIISVTRIGDLETLAATSSSPILVTLMMEMIRSSESSVLTKTTRRNIPEDGILHSHRRVNLKSYKALTGCARWRRCDVSPLRYDWVIYPRRRHSSLRMRWLRIRAYARKFQVNEVYEGTQTYT
jgi:hypothetical protein